MSHFRDKDPGLEYVCAGGGGTQPGWSQDSRPADHSPLHTGQCPMVREHGVRRLGDPGSFALPSSSHVAAPASQQVDSRMSWVLQTWGTAGTTVAKNVGLTALEGLPRRLRVPAPHDPLTTTSYLLPGFQLLLTFQLLSGFQLLLTFQVLSQLPVTPHLPVTPDFAGTLPASSYSPCSSYSPPSSYSLPSSYSSSSYSSLSSNSPCSSYFLASTCYPPSSYSSFSRYSPSSQLLLTFQSLLTFQLLFSYLALHFP